MLKVRSLMGVTVSAALIAVGAIGPVNADSAKSLSAPAIGEAITFSDGTSVNLCTEKIIDSKHYSASFNNGREGVYSQIGNSIIFYETRTKEGHRRIIGEINRMSFKKVGDTWHMTNGLESKEFTVTDIGPANC